MLPDIIRCCLFIASWEPQFVTLVIMEHLGKPLKNIYNSLNYLFITHYLLSKINIFDNKV